MQLVCQHPPFPQDYVAGDGLGSVRLRPGAFSRSSRNNQQKTPGVHAPRTCSRFQASRSCDIADGNSQTLVLAQLHQERRSHPCLTRDSAGRKTACVPRWTRMVWSLTFVDRSRSHGVSSTSWRLTVFFNRRETINSRLDLVQSYHHILYPWVPCSSGCVISYTCIGAYLLHSRSTDQESQWNLVRFSAETALSFSTTTLNSLRTALTLTWPFSKISSSHISVQDSGE